MKVAVNTARVLVGVLFIFSGLVKAIDPLGLAYKMQEFFEAWNMQGLNGYALALSFIMNVFEVLAGAGCDELVKRPGIDVLHFDDNNGSYFGCCFVIRLEEEYG